MELALLAVVDSLAKVPDLPVFILGVPIPGILLHRVTQPFGSADNRGTYFVSLVTTTSVRSIFEPIFF
jgi:hypothetical protein